MNIMTTVSNKTTELSKRALNKTSALTKKALLVTGVTALFNKVSGLDALKKRGLKLSDEQGCPLVVAGWIPGMATLPFAVTFLGPPLGLIVAAVATAISSTAAIRLQSRGLVKEYDEQQKNAQKPPAPRI